MKKKEDEITFVDYWTLGFACLFLLAFAVYACYMMSSYFNTFLTIFGVLSIICIFPYVVGLIASKILKRC